MVTFVITALRNQGSNKLTVGIVQKREVAIEAILSNYCDIAENGHYPYVILEEIEQGIYPVCKRRYFYKYHRGTDNYCPCPEPDWAADFFNFFM